MKELKGGAPRHRFFSQSWTLQVLSEELNTLDHESELVKTTEQENAVLKKKVLSLSNKLKTVNNHEARKQYKPVEELGDRNDV